MSDPVAMHTQCPKCQTIFAVTEPQLSVRDGAVRCGRCMDVFNARWNLVDPPVQPVSSNPDPKPPESPAPTPAADTTPSAGNTPTADTARGPDATPDDSGDSGVMLPEDLVRAFGRGTISRGPRMQAFESTRRPAAPADTPSAKAPASAPDAKPDVATGAHRTTASTVSKEKSAAVDETTKPSLEKNSATRPETSPQPVPVVAKPAADDAVDLKQFSGLVMPEAGSVSSPRRIPASVWMIGTAAMIALLFVQARFFYLDEMAQSAKGRPVAKLMCAWTGCTLPDLLRTKEYRVLATDITFHPDSPSAIRISTRIVNGARIAQPYPDIQLTLTDKSGKIVGRRTFKPAQYLGGAFAPGQRINAESETIIDLDLREPDERAIGFEVELVNRDRVSSRLRG